MAALAYVLLPISGTIVFFAAPDRRARFHGLQAALFGVVWPLVLYAASAVGEMWTRATFLGGAVLWLVVLALTASGRDPSVPGLRRLLTHLSSSSPRA